MKKIFYGSTFIILLLGMYLASCKKETAINATQSTTTQAIDLLDVYKHADAGGVMLYNHYKFNFLTVKPEEYFYLTNRDKLDAELKAFNNQTGGMDYEGKMYKLKEMNYISENERVYLTKFIKTVAENENDMTAAMDFMDKQHLEIAYNSYLSLDEKTRLTIFSTLLKYPAKYFIEKNVSKQKNSNNSSIKVSSRCFLESKVACILANIGAGLVIGGLAAYLGSPGVLVKEVATWLTTLIGSISGAASAAAGILISCGDCDPPTCKAPDVASLSVDGGCNASGTILITGGLDEGLGFNVNNSNASPSYIPLSSGSNTYHISQNSSDAALSVISPQCNPSSGASTYLPYQFNIYSLIHNPGNPSFIQGNNSPSSGSMETYYVLGDVNKPGSQIVASVQGSIGTVIGSIAGQQGYSVQVSWFRSGSGSLSVQTRSACGELSGTVNLPITVR